MKILAFPCTEQQVEEGGLVQIWGFVGHYFRDGKVPEDFTLESDIILSNVELSDNTIALGIKKLDVNNREVVFAKALNILSENADKEIENIKESVK